MQKSKASWQLRGVLKRRTRRWRRRQVVGFYCLMFICLLTTLGNDHHSFRHFFWAVPDSDKHHSRSRERRKPKGPTGQERSAQNRIDTRKIGGWQTRSAKTASRMPQREARTLAPEHIIAAHRISRIRLSST